MRLEQIVQRVFEGVMPKSQAAMPMDNATIMENARMIQEQHFADLKYPGEKQYRAFPSYVCMIDFAERKGCKSVLEIGAGLSTAVWAAFAARTGANISTIDANFSRVKSYITGTRHDAAVSRHVELFEGTSISGDELLGFYTAEPQATYGGVPVTLMRDHIDMFQSRRCSVGRWQSVARIAGKWGWSVRDLITTKSALCWPRPLLDLFAGSGSFDEEVAFFRDIESQEKAGVIDKLVANGSSWDMVFFDSGELSSTVEWLKLKDRIVVGGFAAFHDIFFPKSLKNIIPCASVMADPDWNMLICDDSSKQGLMIAERLR